MKVLKSLVLALAQIVTTDSFPPGLYLKAVVLCESMSDSWQLLHILWLPQLGLSFGEGCYKN